MGDATRTYSSSWLRSSSWICVPFSSTAVQTETIANSSFVCSSFGNYLSRKGDQRNVSCLPALAILAPFAFTTTNSGQHTGPSSNSLLFIFCFVFVFVSLWSAVLIFKVYKCSTCIKFFYREKVRGKFYIPMLQTSRMAVLLIFSSSFHFWYSQSNQVLNLRVVRSRDPSLKWPILKLQWNTSPWELGTSLLWRNVSQHTLYGVQHIHSNLTLIDCIF